MLVPIALRLRCVRLRHGLPTVFTLTNPLGQKRWASFWLAHLLFWNNQTLTLLIQLSPQLREYLALRLHGSFDARETLVVCALHFRCSVRLIRCRMFYRFILFRLP